MEGESEPEELKCESDDDYTLQDNPDTSTNTSGYSHTGNISDGSREDVNNSHREQSDDEQEEQEEAEDEEQQEQEEQEEVEDEEQHDEQEEQEDEEHDNDDEEHDKDEEQHDDDEEEEEEDDEEFIKLGEMLEETLDETLEEEDMDYSPSSRRRSEVDTTETETDESDSEDFPTESLLKELHYLNASCERPLAKKNPSSNTHRSPKKQRRLDFGPSSASVRGGSSVANSSSVASSSSGGRNLRKRTNTPPSLVKLTPRKAESRRKHKPGIVMSSETSDSDDDDSDDEEEDDDDEDDEDDEGVLTIVTQEEQKQQRQQQRQQHQHQRQQLITGKRKTPSSPQTNSGGGGRKRVRREESSSEVPEEVVKLIQSGIDDLLEEKAERTHLTAVHVKNIIKNVMTDENVVAMVRNTVVGLHSDDSGVSAVYEPTLTRAKTKELLEQQQRTGGVGCIWAGLSTHTTNPSTSSLDPETHALATLDFPDEDESDEYHPEADDQVHSEDESMLWCGVSTGGGSPTSTSTPYTPATTATHITTSTPTSEALSLTTHQSILGLDTPSGLESSVFSVTNSAVQRVLKFDKEEVVSQRTRSKLPLTETPLECLEMAFLPPDVTTDMYETEVDNDDWKKFLIDFIHPLKTCEGGEEDEDPEYNILEDAEDAQDLKEEMRGDRAVQISKKEIQQLMTELLDTLEDSDVAPPIRAHLAPLLPHQQHQQQEQEELSPSQPSEPLAVAQHTHTQDEVDGPPPGTIWVEVLTAKFTVAQLEVIRCQMTQHVQLLATSAVMAAGCSTHTHIIDSCIDNLEDVQQLSNSSEYKHTFFNTVNLGAALDLSKAMMEKNYDEQNVKYKKKGKRKSNLVSLKPDLIENILLSSAFPYPRLLPVRMFQLPCMRGYEKTIFVPGEDVLLLMGLERFLDPKYRTIKNKVEKQKLLNVALSKTAKELLVTKTLTQVINRVRNIRSRVKDTPSNAILKFLTKGEVDYPSAEAEPLLVCVPCAVMEMPESVLAPPYKDIVNKRNQTLRLALQAAASKAAARVAKELEIQKLEAAYKGISSIIHQQETPNFVILQPTVGTATTTTTAAAAAAAAAAIPVVNTNTLQPLSFIIQEASTSPSILTLQQPPSQPSPQTLTQTPFVVCPVADESSRESIESMEERETKHDIKQQQQHMGLFEQLLL
ncbi:hypothetical protein Pmani_010990 [Petrolisthes manimaculis]|uniref:Uncharacterized protein n=1 Tax=Petrolisthes manimaculis TaxID=1843537 RepID=A0AAE1Q110_9EUCA|nr:hypothetical protein Pmani_010990 [Petrolisthes manimaculis]